MHQAQSVLALVSILILAASTNPAIFWTWILLSLLALLFASVLLLSMCILTIKGMDDMHCSIPKH